MDLHPDVQSVLDAARKQAGLDDFGDDRFLDGLDRYFAALRQEANLTEIGRAVTSGDVIQLLVNRLRFERDLAAHPEICEEKVAAPLFILGLPRTGTTKLQQMLARDPAVQKIPYWLMINPAPWDESGPDEADPRIAAGEAAVEQTMTFSPNFMKVHPPQAMEPEEEAFMMRLTFEWSANGMFDHTPSYLRWVTEISQEYNYQYLHRLLQYLQWQDGGGRGRPWVLKSPLHSGNIDTLLATFPGAAIVHCHRDPCVAVPSILNLFASIWHERGNQVDAASVGKYLEYFLERTTTNMRKRDELGERARILDVHYPDIAADVYGVVRAVYEFWGRELTPAAIAGMQDWEKANPQYKYGAAEYSLEQFGLNREQVERAFAPYTERFAVRRAVVKR